MAAGEIVLQGKKHVSFVVPAGELDAEEVVANAQSHEARGDSNRDSEKFSEHTIGHSAQDCAACTNKCGLGGS